MSGSATEFLKNPKLNLTMEKNIFPSTNLFTHVGKISTTIINIYEYQVFFKYSLKRNPLLGKKTSRVTQLMSSHMQ